MRHLVSVEVGGQAADALDASGGPGPLFARIGERWKPEVFYVAAGKRAAYWVIDFESNASVAELLHLLLAKTGATPTLVPVLTPAEAAVVVPDAFRKARA